MRPGIELEDLLAATTVLFCAYDVLRLRLRHRHCSREGGYCGHHQDVDLDHLQSVHVDTTSTPVSSENNAGVLVELTWENCLGGNPICPANVLLGPRCQSESEGLGRS